MVCQVVSMPDKWKKSDLSFLLEKDKRTELDRSYRAAQKELA